MRQHALFSAGGPRHLHHPPSLFSNFQWGNIQKQWPQRNKSSSTPTAHPHVDLFWLRHFWQRTRLPKPKAFLCNKEWINNSACHLSSIYCHTHPIHKDNLCHDRPLRSKYKQIHPYKHRPWNTKHWTLCPHTRTKPRNARTKHTNVPQTLSHFISFWHRESIQLV